MSNVSRHRRGGSTIALRGNYHEANFGDDALLVAAHALVAGPGRTVVVDGCIAYQDSRLQGLSPLVSGTHAPDLIVYGGGTQFFAFDPPLPQSEGGGGSRWQAVLRRLVGLLKRGRLLESLRVRQRLRRQARIPTIAVGLGIGPFAAHAESAEAVVAGLIGRMKLVWVRDDASEEFCRRHGVTACVRGADLCFTQAFRSSVSLDVPFASAAADARRRVGIVLRDWPGLDDDFFARMIRLARSLRQDAIEVQFLSFAPTDTDYLAALRAAGEDCLAWDAGYGPLEAFWGHIASHDVILTSRFHGAIFALLSGRPFVAINIEPKLASLTEIAPSIHEPLVAADAGTDEIGNKLRRMLSEAMQMQEGIMRDVARQQERASRAERALSDFLEHELPT